jgi:hypothetical protein
MPKTIITHDTDPSIVVTITSDRAESVARCSRCSWVESHWKDVRLFDMAWLHVNDHEIPAPPQPWVKARQALEAAAADWMETEIGNVYGSVVMEILDGLA